MYNTVSSTTVLIPGAGGVGVAFERTGDAYK